MPFALMLALKYLRPRRSFVSVVTFISVLGVLLGVGILVIVLSVMTGFDNMWRDKILSFKPHLTLSNPYGVIEDEGAVYERLDAIDGITGSAGAIETRVLIQANGQMSAPVLLGVDPARAEGVSQIPANITNGVFDITGENAVLGIDLARSLGVHVGDTILVYSPLNVVKKDELYLPEELTVTGLFDMGMRDFDGSFVLTSLDVARELVGHDFGVFSIYVMTEDAFQFPHYRAAVTEAVDRQYMVQSWDEIDSVLFQALSHEKTMMFLLLVFIAIVAIFCVTNTLIVITVQKTNEIGLMKALGFPSSRIMAIFVWHGWIQCLAGTLGGLGVGLLVLNNLNNIAGFLANHDVAIFPKSIYGLDKIPWHADPVEMAQVAGFVLLFCTLASFIPAYRAARLDPVRALRQE
ncbi:MAG: lipoprotein-releasing system permease protein [Candidatus Promineifilaceae bacterium]|jgi:lipoprotein-releasing system permease protein